MNDNRLSYLVDRYLDVQLTAAERGELEDALRRSATSRAQFWQETRLHALLHEAASGTEIRVPKQQQIVFARWRKPAAALVAVAGCLLVVASVVSRLGRPRPQLIETNAPERETTTAAIAVLSGTLNVEWNGPADAHAPGAALEPGWLRLKSGVAHVQFFNGVGIVLEGPLEVQLVSGEEAFCRSGRMSAEVPSAAHGFTVRTRQLRIVDLGTAFGVYVSGQRDEVHVFTGKVELHPASAAARELRAGEAIVTVGDGTTRAIPCNQAAFMSPADMEHQSDESQGRQLQAWHDASAKLKTDPSLIVLFDFEPSSWVDRTLRNLAAPGAAAADATVVGCGKTEGRWLGKGAIEFRNLSDRVRVSVPGMYRSLTLAACVRVDRLECRFNSLFMTDAFELGAVHWQIRSNGSLHLAVSGPTNESATNYNYDSTGVFAPEKLGRWTHLAMVYDGPRAQMTQYVDGQPIGRFTLSKAIPLRIEHGELGNWNPGNSTDRAPIRYLSGRMDEFELFGRALTDQEIVDLYKTGSTSPGKK
jgi:hypothetical protein